MALIPRLVIVGTPNNNELVAAPTRPWTRMDDDNTIQGLAGDDRIEGGGGDDLIDGGPGNDTIDGGSGADTAVFSQTRQASEVFWYDAPVAGVMRWCADQMASMRCCRWCTWGSRPHRRLSCVDGPLDARALWCDGAAVGCGHVSGLDVRYA